MFLLTVVLTILSFYYLHGRPRRLMVVVIAWAILQSALALAGFYQTTDVMPPRFGLVLLPVIATLTYGLLAGPRRRMLARTERHGSALLHTVRVPVEIALYYLYVYGLVPELMTFTGRNFDILAGLTAPVVGWLQLRGQISHRMLFLWNVVGLGLVLFIVTNGILSAELPFQQFAFEQPNRAVTYFPFILLPAVIVPLVIYTHLLDLVQLWPSVLGQQIGPGNDEQTGASQRQKEALEGH